FRVLICGQLAVSVKPQQVVNMNGSADRATHSVGQGGVAVRSYRHHAMKMAAPYGKPAIGKAGGTRIAEAERLEGDLVGRPLDLIALGGARTGPGQIG